MTTYEHRVSERTLLVPGKVFKAREGPLIRMKDGSVESFADKGPFIFIAKEQNDDVVLLHAYDRNGFHSVLHVAGDRTPGVDQIIPRPLCHYSISQEDKAMSNSEKITGRGRITQKNGSPSWQAWSKGVKSKQHYLGTYTKKEEAIDAVYQWSKRYEDGESAGPVAFEIRSKIPKWVPPQDAPMRQRMGLSIRNR